MWHFNKVKAWLLLAVLCEAWSQAAGTVHEPDQLVSFRESTNSLYKPKDVHFTVLPLSIFTSFPFIIAQNHNGGGLICHFMSHCTKQLKPYYRHTSKNPQLRCGGQLCLMTTSTPDFYQQNGYFPAPLVYRLLCNPLGLCIHVVKIMKYMYTICIEKQWLSNKPAWFWNNEMQ